MIVYRCDICGVESLPSEGGTRLDFYQYCVKCEAAVSEVKVRITAEFDAKLQTEIDAVKETIVLAPVV